MNEEVLVTLNKAVSLRLKLEFRRYCHMAGYQAVETLAAFVKVYLRDQMPAEGAQQPPSE